MTIPVRVLLRVVFAGSPLAKSCASSNSPGTCFHANSSMLIQPSGEKTLSCAISKLSAKIARRKDSVKQVSIQWCWIHKPRP